MKIYRVMHTETGDNNKIKYFVCQDLEPINEYFKGDKYKKIVEIKIISNNPIL